MAVKAILFDSSRCSACQACVAACKGRFGLGPASSSEDMAGRAVGGAAGRGGRRPAVRAVKDEFFSNMSEMRKHWQNVSGKACCQAGLSMLYFRQYQTIKAAALYGNFVS